MAEGIAILGCPDLSAEDTRRGILHYTSSPGGDALTTPIAPVDKEAIEVTVTHCLVRDADLPVAIVIDTLELPHRHRLPVVE